MNLYQALVNQLNIDSSQQWEVVQQKEKIAYDLLGRRPQLVDIYYIFVSDKDGSNRHQLLRTADPTGVVDFLQWCSVRHPESAV